MDYLNLGCGTQYHDAWVNLDFKGIPGKVQEHNLLKGIPFENASFDVLYHSHILEHFTREDGKTFLKECFRVLRNGGILRVVVPDLKDIVQEYLYVLEQIEKNEQDSQSLDEAYDWILIELIDQLARHESGGEALKMLKRKTLVNEQYIYERWGHEAQAIRKEALQEEDKFPVSKAASNRASSRGVLERIRLFLLHRLGKQEMYDLHQLRKQQIEERETRALGRFRLSGEVHQWMYDAYSLKRVLMEVGFQDFKLKDAFTSQIKNWEAFSLDSHEGKVRKPDSLFCEVIKP